VLLCAKVPLVTIGDGTIIDGILHTYSSKKKQNIIKTCSLNKYTTIFMLALKKQVLNFKLKKALKSSVFILFYQINHSDTQKWRKLKHKLSETGNVTSFVIKNKIACKVLKTKQFFIDSLFQGPTFVITCESIQELNSVHLVLNQYSNLFFIGGIYKHKIFTHLDFNSMLELNESIYAKLCEECINPIYYILNINKIFNLEYLKQKQCEFIFLLQQLYLIKHSRFSTITDGNH
jgi:ribosomal protein L10